MPDYAQEIEVGYFLVPEAGEPEVRERVATARAQVTSGATPRQR